MAPNWEQIKGIAERGVYLGVLWAVKKGWVPEGMTGDVVFFIMTGLGLFWGWKVNTKPALEEAAKAVKKAEK